MSKNEVIAIMLLARGATKMVQNADFRSEDISVALLCLAEANTMINQPPTDRMVSLILDLYEEFRDYITA